MGSGLGQIANQVTTGLGAAAGGGLAGIPGAIAGGGIGSSLSGGTGSISDILGTKNKFAASQAPNIQMPTTGDQVQDQYGNATGALTQQQNFVNALQAQNGLGNQSNALQMALNQANGTGPNPALAQLNQSTANNTANQAALMAGQRGAGQNAGLIARQAAMQGAANQQQAAGQAATMQAQQQLAGQQMYGQLANQQVQQQQQGLSQYGQQAQNLYGQTSGNLANQNSTAVGQQAGINSVNAGVAAGNQQANNQLIGNVMGAAGAGLSMLAEGGSVTGPRSNVGKYLHGISSMPKMAEGGKVPALVSPGEVYLKPAQVEKALESKKDPRSMGEKIPGKPAHPGNDYRNDVVSKSLDEGGFVIPNESMESAKKARDFVAAHFKQQALKKDK